MTCATDTVRAEARGEPAAASREQSVGEDLLGEARLDQEVLRLRRRPSHYAGHGSSELGRVLYAFLRAPRAACADARQYPTRGRTEDCDHQPGACGQGRQAVGHDRGRHASGPRWSPGGQWLAYAGSDGNRSGIVIRKTDGSGLKFVAEVQGSNHPVPGTGERLSWAPDNRRIAFVSATPGPEPNQAGPAGAPSTMPSTGAGAFESAVTTPYSCGSKDFVASRRGHAEKHQRQRGSRRDTAHGVDSWMRYPNASHPE